ncbi:MAG: glycosyltransferase [Burkholderiales bacterium]|nr:MAG: glycosyltransferase [Burkholderiales bacterium]
MPIANVAPKRVLVVQRRLTHYRVPFFEVLRADLQSAGLELRLACGEAAPDEVSKRDRGELPWAVQLPTRYFLGGRVCWQPFGSLARDAAVTVITAENKLVYNLVEQFGAGSRRVMLWGHGGNLQGRRDSLRERFKARVALRADWWLAYTALSRDLVLQSGFPAERISVLENAVDTTELRTQIDAITPEARTAGRAALGIGPGPVGIYVGSLYAEKRVDFLLAAARDIRAQLPSFELLVVGGGPQESLVADAAAREPWIKVLGVLRGPDKALALALADVYLHPGAIGLAVQDAFVAGVPLVTTRLATHGPEIAYLDSGRNGVMTDNDLDAYVRASVALLTNGRLHAAMRAECVVDGQRYTLQNMSQRFTEGVLGALRMPIRRGQA